MSDETDKLIRDSLRAARRDSFEAGFADRTIARWKRSRTELSFGDVLARDLKRLTPLVVAAALALGFYNMKSASSGPAVDRLLGLTTVTVDAAYDLGSVQ
jgi:hypothetical protein